MKLFKNWSKTQKNGCLVLALLITLLDSPNHGSIVPIYPYFFIFLVSLFIQFAGIYIMLFLIITLYNDLKRKKKKS